MSVINTLLGIPLGYLMFFCLQLLKNYGLAIILFTLLTKIVMFPLSLMSQKNAISMVKIQPALEDIKRRYRGNNTLIVEEQKALYKQEGYSTFKSLLPLLVQIPIILGLINVIYNPLQHLLHLDPGTINLLIQKTAAILNTTASSMGTGAQLKIMELVQGNPQLFAGMDGVQAILGINTSFLGINLTHIPSFSSVTIIYPALSGLSALALAAYQNKYYVLQQTQKPLQKWSMAAFLVAFSFFFAYILPCGVGLYWIAGNLLSIPVLALCNRIYDPKEHIPDIAREHKVKLTKQERVAARLLKENKRERQKSDKKRFADQNNKQLVFYSESSGFYKYFEGFIEYITDHSDIIIHYVTSDYNDRIFENTNPQIEKFFIGPIALIQFMMLMDADMVVMTMPDLETYHIKRSLVRKDVEYVYLDHGMTSFHIMLKKGALDHFDTIFCYGPNHIEEVRETEKLYGLPAKKLVKTGFPLLDSMLGKVEQLGVMHNNPKVILIAPSWQKDNILEFCLDETLQPLLETGYKVVVRPHPEFIKRFPGKMQAIIDRYSDRLGDHLEIQTDFSSNETVYTADLVVTDWSSIAQEFSYATKKPSLFINTPMKIMNPEYDKIPLVGLEISLRNEIGVSVDVDKLDSLPGIVDELFRKRDHYAGHIARVVQDNIFDVGNGARGGGEYIIKTLTQIKQHKQPVGDEQTTTAISNQTNDHSDALRTIEEQLHTILGNEQLDHKVVQDVYNSDVRDYDTSITTKGEYVLQVLKEIEAAEQARTGKES